MSVKNIFIIYNLKLFYLIIIFFLSKMFGTLGLNHIKYSATDSFVPIKYYNLKLATKSEPINFFSFSAKDFFIEKGYSKITIDKKIRKRLCPQHFNMQNYKPDEFLVNNTFSKTNALPIMKPFSSKPLRIIKNKKNHLTPKTNEVLTIIGNSNKKVNPDQNFYNFKIKTNEKAKERPLTCKSFKEIDRIFLRNKTKKLGYDFEQNHLMKVIDIYDDNILKLAAYERIKRKEEIEDLLDNPNKDILLQRPLSSDQIIRYSQKTSIKSGFEKFLSKRNLIY